MRALTVILAVLVVLIFAGCSESACERAIDKGEGEGSHACKVDIYGGAKGAEEAEREETAEEIKSEVGEVEEVLKRERAEETARAIHELGAGE